MLQELVLRKDAVKTLESIVRIKLEADEMKHGNSVTKK